MSTSRASVASKEGSAQWDFQGSPPSQEVLGKEVTEEFGWGGGQQTNQTYDHTHSHTCSPFCSRFLVVVVVASARYHTTLACFG